MSTPATSGADGTAVNVPGTDTVTLKASDKGIVVRGALDQDMTYDILLNGAHVWSLQPGRDLRGSARKMRADWPKVMQKYLTGHAVVALREHVTGTLLSSCEHVFGGVGDHEAAVVDSRGNPLVLDKWGRLSKTLAGEADQTIDDLMREVARLLDVLREECAVPSYIVFGTLLGAVRTGRLIGYDNDIDIAYVSGHEYPVDIAREGYRIQRILLQNGYSVRRGSNVRLNVRLPLPGGSTRHVDVFTSHWTCGAFFIPSDVGARLPRDAILPLSTVELMGWQMPAPADPSALLAATYGENWRVPDPSFKYETPIWLKRRLAGWFGGLHGSRKHWDSFLTKQASQVPAAPSPFGRWVAANYPAPHRIVDLGTGTGRDALWFAREGRPVLGIDFSGVSRVRKVSHAENLPASFEVLNLYDTRAVLALGARLSREEEPVDLYARFTLHALADHGRTNVWRLASMALRHGGRFFAEFRTLQDQGRPHFFGPHMRRFLEPDEVVAEIEAAGGHVVHLEQGRGLAPFHDEDPHVCRVVAEWDALPKKIRPTGQAR